MILNEFKKISKRKFEEMLGRKHGEVTMTRRSHREATGEHDKFGNPKLGPKMTTYYSHGVHVGTWQTGRAVEFSKDKRNEDDIWCSCESDQDKYPTLHNHFHDDGNSQVYLDRYDNTYTCEKHHWTCGVCNLILQIG